MTAHESEHGSVWGNALPNGLYVREYTGNDERELAQECSTTGYAQRWMITGRNPDFWWHIVVTRLDTEPEGLNSTAPGAATAPTRPRWTTCYL